jgi:hypothetical protein
VTTVRLNELELPLPEGWCDRTVLTIAGPADEGGVVSNVVVTREPLCAGMGLGGFADGHLRLLELQVDEIEVLSTEHATVDGQRALVRTVRFRVGDERPLVQLQAMLVVDGVGHAVIGTASAEGFAAVEPVLRRLLDGFRVGRGLAVA